MYICVLIIVKDLKTKHQEVLLNKITVRQYNTMEVIKSMKQISMCRSGKTAKLGYQVRRPR